jgi:hypothetical protein
MQFGGYPDNATGAIRRRISRAGQDRNWKYREQMVFQSRADLSGRSEKGANLLRT